MKRATSITALILAGGKGTRVGGRDKGMLIWRGMPLAAHVAARIRPQVDRVWISCNRNHAFYATLGDEIVSDLRRDYAGPLAGLEAAMPSLDCEFVTIVGCDTPLLPTDLVARLGDALMQRTACDLSVAFDGEREQYLCALLRRSCLSGLPAYLSNGGRSVAGWYGTLRKVRVDFSADASAFRNYNSSEALLSE